MTDSPETSSTFYHEHLRLDTYLKTHRGDEVRSNFPTSAVSIRDAC